MADGVGSRPVRNAVSKTGTPTWLKKTSGGPAGKEVAEDRQPNALLKRAQQQRHSADAAPQTDLSAKSDPMPNGGGNGGGGGAGGGGGGNARKRKGGASAPLQELPHDLDNQMTTNGRGAQDTQDIKAVGAAAGGNRGPRRDNRRDKVGAEAAKDIHNGDVGGSGEVGAKGKRKSGDATALVSEPPQQPQQQQHAPVAVAVPQNGPKARASKKAKQNDDGGDLPIDDGCFEQPAAVATAAATAAAAAVPSREKSSSRGKSRAAPQAAAGRAGRAGSNADGAGGSDEEGAVPPAASRRSRSKDTKASKKVNAMSPELGIEPPAGQAGHNVEMIDLSRSEPRGDDVSKRKAPGRGKAAVAAASAAAAAAAAADAATASGQAAAAARTIEAHGGSSGRGAADAGGRSNGAQCCPTNEAAGAAAAANGDVAAPGGTRNRRDAAAMEAVEPAGSMPAAVPSQHGCQDDGPVKGVIGERATAATTVAGLQAARVSGKGRNAKVTAAATAANTGATGAAVEGPSDGPGVETVPPAPVPPVLPLQAQRPSARAAVPQAAVPVANLASAAAAAAPGGTAVVPFAAGERSGGAGGSQAPEAAQLATAAAAVEQADDLSPAFLALQAQNAAQAAEIHGLHAALEAQKAHSAEVHGLYMTLKAQKIGDLEGLMEEQDEYVARVDANVTAVADLWKAEAAKQNKLARAAGAPETTARIAALEDANLQLQQQLSERDSEVLLAAQRFIEEAQLKADAAEARAAAAEARAQALEAQLAGQQPALDETPPALNAAATATPCPAAGHGLPFATWRDMSLQFPSPAPPSPGVACQFPTPPPLLPAVPTPPPSPGIGCQFPSPLVSAMIRGSGSKQQGTSPMTSGSIHSHPPHIRASAARLSRFAPSGGRGSLSDGAAPVQQYRAVQESSDGQLDVAGRDLATEALLTVWVSDGAGHALSGDGGGGSPVDGLVDVAVLAGGTGGAVPPAAAAPITHYHVARSLVPEGADEYECWTALAPAIIGGTSVPPCVLPVAAVALDGPASDLQALAVAAAVPLPGSPPARTALSPVRGVPPDVLQPAGGGTEGNGCGAPVTVLPTPLFAPSRTLMRTPPPAGQQGSPASRTSHQMSHHHEPTSHQLSSAMQGSQQALMEAARAHTASLQQAAAASGNSLPPVMTSAGHQAGQQQQQVVAGSSPHSQRMSCSNLEAGREGVTAAAGVTGSVQDDHVPSGAGVALSATARPYVSFFGLAARPLPLPEAYLWTHEATGFAFELGPATLEAVADIAADEELADELADGASSRCWAAAQAALAVGGTADGAGVTTATPTDVCPLWHYKPINTDLPGVPPFLKEEMWIAAVQRFELMFKVQTLLRSRTADAQ